MLSVIEVYEDCRDRINTEQNGQLSYGLFNRFSWIGQLAMLDWLSGDVSDVVPPQPYLSQKNKDWLSPFIAKTTGNVSDGQFPKPEDYYQIDNWYIIGSSTQQDCVTQEVTKTLVCNTPGDTLDGAEFEFRCKTFIKGLKPSMKKPIMKLVGDNFVFSPEDPGSIAIEYIRYPVKARIETMLDTVYNEEVPNPVTSIDFEWAEFSRPILVWFICDQFFNRTREQAGKQFNIQTQKTVRT
jgi:hypothetical protein